VQPDRILKGVVTKATKFVDIGVNQDGLDHISELANHYIKNPNEVVRTEQITN
jgi:uncharacterized protein